MCELIENKNRELVDEEVGASAIGSASVHVVECIVHFVECIIHVFARSDAIVTSHPSLCCMPAYVHSLQHHHGAYTGLETRTRVPDRLFYQSRGGTLHP